MPKFPFTNYHELNLDWILKKVTALFDASEENAQTIRTYETRLTTAEQTATSAATAATAAQQLADAASENADDALSVAGTADSKADSALAAATNAAGAVAGALTTAQEAQQTAAAAVATANDAAATASGLESLANTANQNATAALETAQTADQKAVAAQSAAATADQKAIAAQTAATTNAGNISTLQSDVSNLNRQISELNTEIDYLHYANINIALTQYLKRFIIYGCSHTGNGTYNLTNLPRLTLAKRICLPFSITINSLNGHTLAVQYYDQNGALLNAGPWVTNVTITANTYFQFIMNTDDDTSDSFEVLINETINSVNIIDNALSLYNANINIPPMIKQQMTPLTILNISPQSFDYDEENNRLICYGNSSYFFEYNLITGMSIILSTEMDCGHGNSSCYNKDTKKFYVFGWNTPYITPINMESTPVKETAINTGLTGYLAGAIDFDNNMVYIFQRDSVPDTKAYYNFIIFDLTNNTVISSQKTSIPMIAIQDCKFKDGFIFVNWGTTISHFSCFDTTGKCVYSYENTTQTYLEPEGLAFVDDSIFISAYDGTKFQTFKLINSERLFA